MTPPHFLRALSSPNYRRYLLGQCVSLMGNWMTTTAALWLVYQLSGDPWEVGLVGFASQVPVLFFAPFAGVLIDRRDALQLMRFAQVLAMLQSAALATLTLTGHMTSALNQLTLLSAAKNSTLRLSANVVLPDPGRPMINIRLVTLIFLVE